MIKDVKIPEISENVKSGKIVNVLVQVGDMIEVDDVLVEFETEKALVEIPSTVKGKITEMLAKVGEEMQVGDVIARVDTEAGAADEDKPKAAEPERQAAPAEPAAMETTAEKPAEAEEPEQPAEKKAASTEKEKPAVAEEQKPQAAPEPAQPEEKISDRPPDDRGPAPASPSVRRFARELGVDIYAVRASGPGGRITEADVKAYVKSSERPAGKAPGREAAAEIAVPMPRNNILCGAGWSNKGKRA